MQKRSKDMEYIEFNGINSLDLNIGITSRTGILGSAERDVSVLSVPGRDGDLVVDNGRYKNVEVTFESYILPESPQFKDDYELFQLCQKVKEWLTKDIGYCKLKSSKQPGYYRLARLSNKLDISDVYFQIGSCTLYFDCYPYMYSESGDTEVIVLNGIEMQLYNVEGMESKPIIHLIGSGNATITLNKKVYHLNAIADSIYVDSEREITYSENGIEYGKLEADDFPVLQNGINNLKIEYDSGITKAIIIPRWRRL